MTIKQQYSNLIDRALEMGMLLTEADNIGKPTRKDLLSLQERVKAHMSLDEDEAEEDDTESLEQEETEAEEFTSELEDEEEELDPEQEREARLEKSRLEVRNKYLNAKSASSAHAFALISAATQDGDRREAMLAKLNEMPESVRAGACKLARRYVERASAVDKMLVELHAEMSSKFGGSTRASSTAGWRSESTFRTVSPVRKDGKNSKKLSIRMTENDSTPIGANFHVSKAMVNGKIVFTLTQA